MTDAGCSPLPVRPAPGCPDEGTYGGSCSPDGAKIAYVVYFGGGPGGSEIRVGDLATNQCADVQITPTTDNPLNLYGTPRWSPDGKWIAYTDFKRTWAQGWPADGDPVDLYIVRPDGTGRTLILQDIHAGATSICWSPDGTEIAYTDWVSDTDHRPGIWAVKVANPTQRRLIIQNGYNPSWGEIPCDRVEVLGDFLNVGRTNLCALVREIECAPASGANVWFTGQNLWGQTQSAGDPDPNSPNAILTGLFGVGCRAVMWPPDVYKVVAQTADALSDPVVVTVVSPYDAGIFAGGAIKEWCWGAWPNIQSGYDWRRVTVGFEYVFPLWLCSMLDHEAGVPEIRLKCCFDLPRGKHEALLVEDPDNPLGPVEFSAKDFDHLCLELVPKTPATQTWDDSIILNSKRVIVKAICFTGRGLFRSGNEEPRKLKFELCFNRSWHRNGWRDPIFCLKVFEPDPKVIYSVCGPLYQGGFRVKSCPH